MGICPVHRWGWYFWSSRLGSENIGQAALTDPDHAYASRAAQKALDAVYGQGGVGTLVDLSMRRIPSESPRAKRGSVTLEDFVIESRSEEGSTSPVRVRRLSGGAFGNE